MKKIASFIFLSFILLFLNSAFLIQNSFSQWVQQTIPVTSGSFNDMKFVNANTGFIFHWNYPVATLFKTTNAGYTWQTLNNWGMGKVAIVDTGCIYTSGYNNSKGVLYKSTNLGITWDSIISSSIYYYNNIQFFNRDTGLISSGDTFENQIWRTTNGGQSLQLMFSVAGATSGKFYFLKEKVNGEYYGWMYYPSYPSLYRTTNSGLNWIQLPSFSNNLNSIFFVNQDTGWATITNYTNYIYMTTNGGVNWIGKYNNLNEVYFDIFFVNAQKGWISGLTNKICVTTNGGNNWGTQNIQSFYTSKLFFLDSLNGWLESSSNTVAHTTNGGGPITRVEKNTNTNVGSYKLFQNFPNPFNQSTIIKYQTSKTGNINIKILDISGKEIISLVNKKQIQGEYEILFDAVHLNSGIYFCQMLADGNIIETRKMIYLK